MPKWTWDSCFPPKKINMHGLDSKEKFHNIFTTSGCTYRSTYSCEFFWKWFSTVATFLFHRFLIIKFIEPKCGHLFITDPNSTSWSFSWLYLQPPLPCLADPRAHTEGIHHVPLHFPLLREGEEAEGLKSISQTRLTLLTMLISTMDSHGAENPTQAGSMRLYVHSPTHQRSI